LSHNDSGDHGCGNRDHGDGGTQSVHYTHRSPQSLTGVRVSRIGFGS